MVYKRNETSGQVLYVFLSIISCWYYFFASTYSLRPFPQLFWISIACLSVVIGALHSYKLDRMDQAFFSSMFILFIISFFSVDVLGSISVIGNYIIYYIVAKMLTKNCNPKNLHNVIFAFSLVHLICIFIQIILPSIYTKVILPLLPLSSHEMIIQQMEWNKAYYGFTIQSSMCAMYLSIGVILSALRIKNCKQKLSATLYFVLTVLFIIAIFFTQRRGSAGACILILALIYMSAKGNKLSKILLFISAVIMLGIIGIENIPGVSGLFGKMQSLLKTGDVFNNRDSIFIRGVKAFIKRPLFGYGGGQVYAAIGYAWLENSFISVLLQWGLLGTLFFFTPYVKMTRMIFDRIQEYDNKTFHDFAKYVLILFFIMSFVENYLGEALSVFILFLSVFSGRKNDEKSFVPRAV